MAYAFTDWEETCLAHHGINGMKWGVRRFQNEDGSLTAAGEKRYGAKGTGSSARAMTRHLNKLDKGYANVEARRHDYARTAAKYARKFNRALDKGKVAKAEKLKAKALKYGTRAGQANKNKRAIENLQFRIMAKAAQRGYTVKSKAVERVGHTGKTTVARALGVGNIYTAAKGASNFSKVSGQEFTVKRRGDGRTQIVNYNGVNRAGSAEDRRKERMRRNYESRR